MDWNAFVSGKGGQAVGGFLDSYFKAKASRKVTRAYNDQIQKQAVYNQGILRTNQAQVRAEAVDSRLSVQRAKNRALGEQRSKAGFAGASGGSVDAGAFDISRAAASTTDDIADRASVELVSLHEAAFQQSVQGALMQRADQANPSFAAFGLQLAGAALETHAADTGSDGTGQPKKQPFSVGALLNL